MALADLIQTEQDKRDREYAQLQARQHLLISDAFKKAANSVAANEKRIVNAVVNGEEFIVQFIDDVPVRPIKSLKDWFCVERVRANIPMAAGTIKENADYKAFQADLAAQGLKVSQLKVRRYENGYGGRQHNGAHMLISRLPKAS